MEGFEADVEAMSQGAAQLDAVAQDLAKAGAEAVGVAVADGAFGRLPESAAARSALEASAEQVSQDLRQLASAVTWASEGVIASAQNYVDLDRAGADRLRAATG